MLTFVIGLVLANKLKEAKRLLDKNPNLWDELESHKIATIILDVIEREISPKAARIKINKHIPFGSDMGEEIMIIYGSLTESQRKSKVRSIRFAIYEDRILNKFVLFGGKRTQLVTAALQKLFSEIGTEPENLFNFVKSWHGKLWRNKLEHKEYFEYAMKYDKDILKNDGIGIPDNKSDYAKPNPIKVLDETIAFMKEKRDTKLKPKVIPKRESVPNLSPEKDEEIKEIKRNQQVKERKKKLKPKKSLIEKELEADKNFKPNTTEEVLEFIELQKQKAEIEKKMKQIGKKGGKKSAER